LLDQSGKPVTRRRCGRLRRMARPELDRRAVIRARRAERRAKLFVGPFRQGAKVSGGFLDGMWPVLDAGGKVAGAAVSRKVARQEAQALNDRAGA
jgi:hypothetical protein